MSEEGVQKFTWGKPQAGSSQRSASPPIVSFIEICSEELANQLQEQDLLEFDREQEAMEASLREMDDPEESIDCSNDYELALQLSEDPDCSVDAMFALELQRQFDRESEIQRQLETGEKASKNGGTKITLGTESFAYTKLENEIQQKEENFDDEESRQTATDQLYDSKVEKFPRSGFKKNENGEIVTKHNKEIGQKKNCQKMMMFPAGFNSGDVIESKLSSRIYNDLQMFSKAEMKRSSRLKDKEQIATSDTSVDVKTRLILLKWINNGELDRVEGVIAVGKESTVLNGVCDAIQEGTSTSEGISEERRFAVKVHKQTLSAFRNRGEYVKDDFRFKNPRGVLKVWTEKEFVNLRRLHNSNLPSPVPIKYKKHVLLMSLIQDQNGKPAPKLKHVQWQSEEEKVDVFNQVKGILIRMYNDCKLVHADLSEFNILYTENKVYVIDVAQAVDLSHPNALVYLERDVSHVLDFFGKQGTEGLPTRHALFIEITSLEVDPEKDLLSQIESLKEQNFFTQLAIFRKKPNDFELMLANKDLEDKLDESDESEDEE